MKIRLATLELVSDDRGTYRETCQSEWVNICNFSSQAFCDNIYTGIGL
jgi:hypothetical protein